MLKPASTTHIASKVKADTPSHILPSWPDKPLVVIKPRRSSMVHDLQEVWAYRELFFFLTWRDVKVRYKQTLLGVAWAIIQPLCAMLIFTLFFGRLAGVPSDGIPYSIFAYAGLLPWTFFSNAVTNSGNSLVGSSNLVTKVYFPRMIIPAASVGAGLVDFAVAFVILLGLMAFYGVSVGWSLVMLPVLVVLTTLISLSIGMWMSALNVKYRDIRYIMPFLMQLWLFASPVIYPLSMIPAKWRLVMMLNPMTGIIEGFRSAFFGKSFDWLALSLSAVITLILFMSSAYAFRRMEKSFADII